MEKLHKSFTKELLIKMKVGWKRSKAGGRDEFIKKLQRQFLHKAAACSDGSGSRTITRSRTIIWLHWILCKYILIIKHAQWVRWLKRLIESRGSEIVSNKFILQSFKQFFPRLFRFAQRH